MNYYIGDTHFGHENVIRFDERPFENAEAMDQFLIERWNKKVGADDDIYILGDFCYRSEKEPLWYLKRLHGKKHLIIGNHDRILLKNQKVREEFVSIDQMLFVTDEHEKLVLCHYPLAEWNQYFRGAYHIYGHIHGKREGGYRYLEDEERALNAGCMVNYYEPVTLKELIQNNQTFRKNQTNLWKIYGNHKGPMQLEDGSWIMPSKALLTEKVFMDRGSTMWIFSEYFWKGLTYHYQIEGERTHEHSFEAVMEEAFYHASTFEISEEDTAEYSKQELDLIAEIVRRRREENE